jgi:hypothetical protein
MGPRQVTPASVRWNVPSEVHAYPSVHPEVRRPRGDSSRDVGVISRALSACIPLSPAEPVPSTALGSSSWVFAAPLSTFDRYRPGPQGLPCAGSRSLLVTTTERVPPDLRLIFRATRWVRGSLAALARHPATCLSWDSFKACALLPTLPVRVRSRSLENAASNQLTDAIRPRGFAPPRRFAPRSGSRACCIPEPARVRSVSASRRPLPHDPPEGGASFGPEATGHPRYALTPLEEVPPTAAVLASPRALAPSPLRQPPLAMATLGHEALLRCRVRCSCRLLPVDRSPLLPWAYFPSRVLTGPREPTRGVSTSARSTHAPSARHAVADASNCPFR